jgi:hypothetical protein
MREGQRRVRSEERSAGGNRETGKTGIGGKMGLKPLRRSIVDSHFWSALLVSNSILALSQ